ncbi:MAG: integrase core domain-containing protein [bacterium]|nr:integrase core domain-containing protein [bacterium]
MKKEVFDSYINRQLLGREGAKLLHMHPKAFLRLKARYMEHGEAVFVPKKTGPKGPPVNRTADWIENIVVELARENKRLGPIELSEELFEKYGIKKDQSTVFRILQRKRIRYCREPLPRIKVKPQLYCLETPGLELQMDACYPFGRGRKIVCFDAIDDCSRYVTAKLYDRETAENAIAFVKELVRVSPFRIQRIRVDNRYGKQLRAFCKTIGIEVVTIAAYTPSQNGKIERFHRTIKMGFFWRHCGFYDEQNYIQYKLNAWVHWYNTERKHGGYGMNRLTPRAKLAGTLFNSLYIIPQSEVTLTLQSYTD